MRSAHVMVWLSLGGCWNGADALHEPCTEDAHCGRGQSCIDAFCDGPPDDGSTAVQTETGTGTDTDTDTDTGGTCMPVVPSTCDPTAAASTRALVATVLTHEGFGRGLAVVSGEFAGNGRIDLAVLSGDNYSVVVMENAGNTWIEADVYGGTALTELRDLLAVDLDRDGETEFVMLSELARAEVVDWTNEVASPDSFVELPTSDLVSFTAADLFGDAGLELVVAGASAVHFVPNEGGALDGAAARSVPGSFAQPWDTLVVGEGNEARVIVPESDSTATTGAMNQVVHLLRIADGVPSAADDFGSDFQNPWALAQGDFLGDEGLEIAVAERRLDLPDVTDGTTSPGRLRFFSLVGDVATEMGAPLEIGVGPNALAAADLDCDGKDELVIGTTGSPGQYDGQPQVLFGSCDGSASPDDLLTLGNVEDTGVSAGSRMAVGDFDGDGLLEVAIADVGDLEVATALGERVVFVGVQEAM